MVEQVAAAAGLDKQKDVPDEKQHSVYIVGLNLLNEYILTNYPGTTPFIFHLSQNHHSIDPVHRRLYNNDSGVRGPRLP